VEGRQAVRELLRAGRRAVHQVFVSEAARSSPVIEEILALCESSAVPVRSVGRPQIEAMSETDSSQGVLARAEPLRYVDIDELMASEPGAPPLLVVLDGVTDPHNLGAVMRSALCAGASGLVLGRHRSARLGAAAIKAAAGAVEHLPVSMVAGIPNALVQMSDAGIWTVGLDASSGTSLWELEVATQPIGLVLGDEGKGLSHLALRRCEVVAAIPMTGPLGSLNVSAVAALACFEVARRRAGGALPPPHQRS
jgi:23S rRNA (guanosine2251-2'-O)-methyltransferase